MSFESKVMAFSTRFLSERSYELIVAPALADLQFEQIEQGSGKTAADTAQVGLSGRRLAVLKALSGAVRMEMARHAGIVILLTLVPACYYFVLIAICADFFSDAAGREGLLLTIARVAAPLLAISGMPVMVCFWPERRVERASE